MSKNKFAKLKELKSSQQSYTPPAQAPAAPAPTALPVAEPQAKRKAETYKKIGFQVRPEALKLLRILKAEQEKEIRVLVGEALNLLFEKYGKAQVG